MGRFSDDEAVEQALNAAETDYLSAQAALRGAPDDAEALTHFHEARDNFATARQAARAGRGMGMTTE